MDALKTELSDAAIEVFVDGAVDLVALGAPLTSLALLFGPAEYFSLMVLGLVAVTAAYAAGTSSTRHGGDERHLVAVPQRRGVRRVVHVHGHHGRCGEPR